MWIRLRLDIGWSDLVYGAVATLLPVRRGRLIEQAARQWSGPREAVICLSVRTGWDLLLQSLDLPAGAEVLFSAFTVPDMARIARLHGLVPVPVDLEASSSVISLARLRKAMTSTTRLLVVAHLFGACTPLEGILRLAAAHGVLVVEDCAQAYRGTAYRGHPRADATMFSFGPIKTASAMGGGVICVRDGRCAARMRAIQSHYAIQSRAAYGRRLAKSAFLKGLSARPIFGAIISSCRYLGWSVDRLVGGAGRGFPGDDLLAQIRRQPSAALLALLLRRWQHYDLDRIACRVQLATAFERYLFGTESTTPRRWECNAFWLFPLLCERSEYVVERLRAAGFDATNQTRLAIVAAPEGRDKETTCETQRLADQLLLVPFYPELSEREIAKMAGILRGHVRRLDIRP